MFNLPLKAQILLAPSVIIVLIVSLIAFTLVKLNHIKSQNEVVREWVRICEHADAAVVASKKLDSIAQKMQSNDINEDDDLHFSYLEQYRYLSEHIRYPELQNKLTADTLSTLLNQESKIQYDEQLDPSAVHMTLQNFIPKLENLYKSFWAQKRAAYEDYYDNVNMNTSRLIDISLWFLAVSVVAGIALSFWTFRKTRNRLQVVTSNAKRICDGDLNMPEAPTIIRDELDELSMCMSSMTKKLVNVVAAEKVLEGAEDERRRIAMDMHDQTLSDLTSIARYVESLKAANTRDCDIRKLDKITTDLDELADNLRHIMDDLHPQSLEILGLHGALQSHIDKHLNGGEFPSYFIQIDSEIDQRLTPFQRLSIYRICLEVVNNIIRHANCNRYEITGRVQPQGISLIIEDNGSGFDYNQVMGKSSLGRGLINIEERAKATGGSVFWAESRFSSGSRFELRLPLTKST